MELSTSSPSLIPLPPPCVSVSKSSNIYPVVHPVPDPTAHAGFSPVPLYNAGPKDKIQTDSSSSSSFADSEKTDQSSSLHVDSFTSSDETSTALSPTFFEQSHEISSHTSAANCENGLSGSSRHSVSLLPKKNYEKLHVTEEEKVLRITQEELDENDHRKVTVS